MQAAALASTTGDAVGAFDTDADPAERSGRPAAEARLRLQWGEEGRQSEIGCGGHASWIATNDTDFVQSDAVACDARIIVGPIEARGEGYRGHALRGLGGGGVSQNLNKDGGPLTDTGFWGQLSIEVNPVLRFGGGCGADKPDEATLPSTARLHNQSCSGYTIIHPGGPIFIGGEFRRLETRYNSGPDTSTTYANNHINVSIGFEF